MLSKRLQEIEKEFKRIKGMDYIKDTRNKLGSVDKTFEDLMDLSKYHNIHFMIKNSTIKNFKIYKNLKNNQELKKLKSKYGYYDEYNKKSKIINCDIGANCSTDIGGRFLFKLKIDYEKEKIYLLIMDKYFNFIEQKIFWDFSDFKDKLTKKRKYLVYIKAWPKIINNKKYYKYYDIEFYELKPFNEIIKLIEEGLIRLNINMNNKNSDAHFEISSLNYLKMFNKIS